MVPAFYWSEAWVFYIKLRKAQPDGAGPILKEYIWPFVFLVVLSVLLLGVLSFADEHTRASLAVGDLAKETAWSRFGIAVVQVFPNSYLPLGVVMYAYWGAFVYNNYNFIRRIIDDDFPPRVLIMGTLRVFLAVFASILMYFFFFPELFNFEDKGSVVEVTLGSEKISLT